MNHSKLYERPALPPDADLSYIEPELRALALPVRDIVFDPNNANTHDDEQDVEDLRGSLAKFGQMKPIVVDRKGAICIAGEGTCIVTKQLGREYIAAVLVDKDALTQTGYAIADNETARKKWDLEVLSRLMVGLRDADPETARATGIKDEAIDAMAAALRGEGGDGSGGDGDDKQRARVSLAERFGVPPFSVLNAQQGYWMERKKTWLKLGVDSAAGRGFGHKGDTAGTTLGISAQAPSVYIAKREYDERIGHKSTWEDFVAANPQVKLHTGTSLFDPVLCELAYRWFCPEGGKVLDPFAGEATKGIVAAHLGFQYTGVELRESQVEINRDMAAQIGVSPEWICGDSAALDSLLPPGEMYDFIWTSPPYYDLEIYSESEKDGSAFETYEKFMEWYRAIFEQAVARLSDNRFLGVKIGEVRDKKTGAYRNFVGDNIACFRDLGLHYYNEAILVTPYGSAAVRAGKQFSNSRKLAKVHQNILYFYKGDMKQIREDFPGEIEFAPISEQSDSSESDS